jgi:hypothetical protein
LVQGWLLIWTPNSITGKAFGQRMRGPGV